MKKPNWNKAEISEMQRELNGVDWQEILSGNTESDWIAIKHTLNSLVDRYVPLSTCKPPTQPRWINREIIRLIRRKKRAWKTYKQYPNVQNLGNYKELEKEVTAMIKRAKRGLERKLAFSQQGNAKTFAGYIKSKTKAVVGVGPLKRADGTLATEDTEVAEILNKFFAGVFAKEDTNNLPYKAPETGMGLETVNISEDQVLKKIKKLRENSAGGPDRISAKILRLGGNTLLAPLRKLFTDSLRTGVVPADWRTAEVIPIFKKGSKGDAGNYRPVSLTSIPGKLMESLIKD